MKSCTCLSISRDPLCHFHGDRDKVASVEVPDVVARLRALDGGDPESAHYEADMLLLELIDNEDVREAWDSLKKWYS